MDAVKQPRRCPALSQASAIAPYPQNTNKAPKAGRLSRALFGPRGTNLSMAARMIRCKTGIPHFEIESDLMASEVSGTVTFMNQGVYNVLEIAAMYRLYLCGDLAVGAGLAYRTLSQANVFSPILSADINGFTLNIQCDLNAGTGSGFTNIFAIGLGYRF